jgi:hypothetical protein
VVSFQAVHDAPVEGVQPGTVLLAEDGKRDVRYDPASFSYSLITGNFSYLNSTMHYLEVRRQPGQYLAAVRSFYMASPFIATLDQPLLPIYSEFRNRPEYPVADLETLIDSHRLEYFLISVPVMRALYPEAAALIQSRCKTDVSRAAGLAPQTGLQLLHCQ